MEKLSVRRFAAADAKAVATLIQRALLEVNIRDYSPEEMEHLAGKYTCERVAAIAAESHFYVVAPGSIPVGCAAISPHGDKPGWAWVHAVFTHPEWQRRGVGHAAMDAVEQDVFFQQAHGAELGASKTALSFYLGLGWQHASEPAETDASGLYRLWKTR